MSGSNGGRSTRPPIIYLAAFILCVVLQSIWPIAFAPKSTVPFGVLIAVLAVILFIWSIRTFRSAHTPVPGNRPTTTIVSVGPYRFSRNPIYLSFSAFQVGIAVGINDAWLLVTLAPAIAGCPSLSYSARSNIWTCGSASDTRAITQAFGVGCEAGNVGTETSVTGSLPRPRRINRRPV